MQLPSKHSGTYLRPSIQNSFTMLPATGPRLTGSPTRISRPCHSPGCASTVAHDSVCARARPSENPAKLLDLAFRRSIQSVGTVPRSNNTTHRPRRRQGPMHVFARRQTPCTFIPLLSHSSYCIHPIGSSFHQSAIRPDFPTVFARNGSRPQPCGHFRRGRALPIVKPALLRIGILRSCRSRNRPGSTSRLRPAHSWLA